MLKHHKENAIKYWLWKKHQTQHISLHILQSIFRLSGNQFHYSIRLNFSHAKYYQKFTGSTRGQLVTYLKYITFKNLFLQKTMIRKEIKIYFSYLWLKIFNALHGRWHSVQVIASSYATVFLTSFVNSDTPSGRFYKIY